MNILSRMCFRSIGAVILAGLTAACSNNQYAPDELPDNTLPPVSTANPRNYTKDMGSLNPAAIAKLAGANNYNVLFITSDEHNAQMTGYERTVAGLDPNNIDIQTPNIDKLAGEGVYFTKAYDACPLCAPTRQSIYTGLYPVEHGQLNDNSVFQQQPTWADFFSAQGYYTAVIGKTHDNDQTRNFGFQYVIKNSGNGKSPELNPPAGLPKTITDPNDQLLYLASPDSSMRGSILQDPRMQQDGMVTLLVKDFLAQNRDRKFFLHASLTTPHWPWNSPADFYYKYDPATIQMPVNMGPPVDYNPLTIYQNGQWDKITMAQHRMFRARYMGGVSWLDSNVGQIVDTLDELGLKDKTLVIYSSDHGDMCTEKGMWFKLVMYEQSARVPLVMRMPGIIEPGTINDTLINHVDYFPTIAGLTGNGAHVPDYLTGLDLTSAVLGITDGPDYTFSLHSTSSKGQVPRVQMVRSKDYKLVRYLGGGAKEYTLYNITADPHENNNLITNSAYKGISDSLKTVLADFMASLRYSNLPFVTITTSED